MKRKQPFWVRLFSPVRLKTQRIYVAGSHPRVRLAAFNVFVGVGSFLVAFLLGSVLMIPGESNAEDISVLSNDASLSVALTPEAMNLAVTPTPDGTLASDELAIQVSTDNTTGYTLTLALAGAESSLYNPTSGGEIQSTTAAMRDPNTLAVNTWGWYPDSLANNTGNLFSALPSNSGPYELKKTSSATLGSGDTTTISFGVNVDTDLPAGSYTNAIVVSAVTNYVPQPILDVYPTTGWAGDTITLYSNGGFVNVQSVQIGGTDCTSINVKSADELTCTLPNKTETNTTSGTDNGYDIQVNVVGGQMENHNFTIRYFNPNRTEIGSVSNINIFNINMSSFTEVDCASLSVGDVISLTDERNGQTYRIKKMQDEKCWMVDNMKYKGEGITISNIDGTKGITLNDTDGKHNTVDGEPGTGTGTNYDKAFYNNPMVASYCYGDSIQSSYAKCGYLYNWYAATAGTGTYNVVTEGANASDSICPVGWRLPSATSDGSTATSDGVSISAADFPVLKASMYKGSLSSGSSYQGSAPENWLFTGAWPGVFSGLWDYGSLGSQGYAGYYWSSTASSYASSFAKFMFFNNTSGGVVNGSNRSIGRAVRCVMDEVPVTEVDITYDANGGYFDDDLSKTNDLITYRIGEPSSTETKIAKTSNISDDGTDNGGGYVEADDGIQTITIPGAKSLRVTVTYQITGGVFTKDYLAIYDGSVTPDSTNYDQSISGKLDTEDGFWGGNGEKTTKIFIIPGDTVQFYFSAYQSPWWEPQPDANDDYGYYAIVQKGPIIVPSDEASTPARPGYTFLGWYTDVAGTAGNEFTVSSSMESGAVYAKWAKDPLTIIFDGNGNTDGNMKNQMVAYGGSISLSPSEYAKTGYAFIGWNTEANGSGVSYEEGATFHYSDPTTAESITLYAQWRQDVGIIQNFTKSQCQSLASDTEVVATDIRDNSQYTLRYINGNCWMTQNLRIAGGTTLNSSTSNVASNYTLPADSTSGFHSYTVASMHYSGDTTTGAWYNLCAASAGTNCQNSTQYDTTYDICPKGWRLPTQTEFSGITGTSYISAFSPVLSGYYSNGTLLNASSAGRWWSATAYDSSLQYYLDYASSGSGSTSYSINKFDGLSVRCIRSS